jgi:hypothetical protein
VLGYSWHHSLGSLFRFRLPPFPLPFRACSRHPRALIALFIFPKAFILFYLLFTRRSQSIFNRALDAAIRLFTENHRMDPNGMLNAAIGSINAFNVAITFNYANLWAFVGSVTLAIVALR